MRALPRSCARRRLRPGSRAPRANRRARIPPVRPLRDAAARARQDACARASSSVRDERSRSPSDREAALRRRARRHIASTQRVKPSPVAADTCTHVVTRPRGAVDRSCSRRRPASLLAVSSSSRVSSAVNASAPSSTTTIRSATSRARAPRETPSTLHAIAASRARLRCRPASPSIRRDRTSP